MFQFNPFAASQCSSAVSEHVVCVAPFIGLIPAMVEKELGGGKQAVGWLITGQGLGAVITGLTLGSWSPAMDPTSDAGFDHRGSAGSHSVCVRSELGVGRGADPRLRGTVFRSALQLLHSLSDLQAPVSFRGRVLSLNQVILGAVYAVSLNVEGQLGDRLGLRQVAIGGAVLGLVVLLVIGLLRPGYSASLDPPEAVVSPS